MCSSACERSFLMLTNSVGNLTDANKRTRSYNPRDCLPDHVPETSKSCIKEAIPPTIDNHESPHSDTCQPDGDNLDLFNAIPPDSRAELLPLVVDSIPSPGSHLLINPCSRASLYRNLLYLVNVRKPSAPLPSLVDYHCHYPSWQSTRSYNFLIDLSLRHRQLGITGYLFRSLKRNGLSMNLESHKLMVRSLIQHGMWEEAWDYVWSLIRRKSLPRDPNGPESIPFTIWLELCRAPKKRRKSLAYERSSTSLEEKYQYLHNVIPGDIPSLGTTSPFAIFCLVDLMLRTDRQQAALLLTKEYFKALPRFLNKKLVLGCLRIIHSHMARSTAKSGLPRFFDIRRTLISFLRLHPSLRPNGKTLCLLFNSLQKAKKCGTVAWKQLAIFKKNWGPQVQNHRVLRRVSLLALKEGRLDITKKIHDLDFASRVRRRRQLREESVVGRPAFNSPGQRRRLPYRLIYPRNGKEARLWYRHRARIRLKRWRISLKGLFLAPISEKQVQNPFMRARDTGP